MLLNVLEGDRSKDQVDMWDGRENVHAISIFPATNHNKKKTFSAITY